MMTTLAVGSFTIMVLGVGGLAALYYGWQQLMWYLAARAQEQSRREALAYVAEGSMSAEVAERLLKAGAPVAQPGVNDEDAEAKAEGVEMARQRIIEAYEATKRDLFALVPAGRLTTAQAANLLDGMKGVDDFDPETPGDAGAFVELHKTYRAILARLGSGEIDVAQTQELILADRPIWRKITKWEGNLESEKGEQRAAKGAAARV